MKNLHKEFVRLGRERNRATYKLLALLPKIEKLKIYEKEGYGNIYEYAAKIAGLSPGVVQKTLRLDENMMFMFLKLKRKFEKNLSSKECLRRILEEMEKKDAKKPKSQPKAKKPKEIPGDFPEKPETRYIKAAQRQNVSDHCSHPGCHRPADLIHHPDRFSKTKNHKNLKPLCKQHHEFAHNGITEPMKKADYQYRRCRQEALL